MITTKQTQPLLARLRQALEEILGGNLVGIYLHGSLAFGCYNPRRSDIDFLVVVRHRLQKETKQAIVQVLEGLWTEAPPEGFEMSVLLLGHCRRFTHPCPYELHYSKALRDAKGAERPDKGPQTDPDLAAHITVLHAGGAVLCGPPIGEVFAKPGEADYLDSVLKDLEDAAHGADGDLVSALLNLCRTLCYLRTGRVVSKAGGGEWAQQHLPREQVLPVAQALESYCTGAEPNWEREWVRDMCSLLLRRVKKEMAL